MLSSLRSLTQLPFFLSKVTLSLSSNTHTHTHKHKHTPIHTHTHSHTLLVLDSSHSLSTPFIFLSRKRFQLNLAFNIKVDELAIYAKVFHWKVSQRSLWRVKLQTWQSFFTTRRKCVKLLFARVLNLLFKTGTQRGSNFIKKNIVWSIYRLFTNK